MKTIAWINGRLPTFSLAMTALATLGMAGQHAKAQGAGSSDIVIINNDDPGEGLNDPTPVEPVGGNPGLTLGDQRLNVVEAAVSVWKSIIVSDVPIELQVQFDPLPCTSDTAVLGVAGPIIFSADFPGAQLPETIYAIAQANQQAGSDLDPGRADINATFNSSLGTGSNCYGDIPFYHGIDGQPDPEGKPSLLDTVLHEMAHGLGFTSTVDERTGERLADLDDIFSRNLEDQTLGLSWPEMTDGERAASAINTGNLQWTGPLVRARAAEILQEGAAADGDVLMFAPNPVVPGSSVVHFDRSLSPDELMEPNATPTSILDLTTAAFADMGWPINPGAAQLY